MTITLAQGLAVRTPDQALAEVEAGLAAANVDATGLSPFSVTAQLPAQVALARSREDEIRATALRVFAGDFSNVPDEWVDAFANAQWGADFKRIEATKARYLWPVTSAAGTITIPAYQAIADGGTSLFENVSEIKVTAGAPQLVEFRARTAGTDGNVSPGAVAGFQVGAAGLGITSPAGSRIVAGAPRETSAAMLKRGRARVPNLSTAGNAVGFDAWVREVAPSVTKWAVDDTNPNGPGSTDLYAANAAGGATVDELAALDAFFQPRRGKGTGPLRTLAAPEQTLAFGLVLRSKSSATATANAANSALQALQAALPLGGSDSSVLFLDSIRVPLLAILGVYEATFSGIAEETPITPLANVVFAATLQVKP